MMDRNSRRDFLKGLAGGSLAAAGFHGTVSAQTSQQVRIERGVQILDLAESVPVNVFDQTENGGLSWMDDGSIYRESLPIDGATTDLVPPGLCWVGTTEPFTVQVTLSGQPTTGTVSVTGDGWVGLHLDEELPYRAFDDCGTEPTAYTTENGEEVEISLAGDYGSLDPGLYFVETTESCTIPISESRENPDDTSGTLTFDGQWSLFDLDSGIPISEFADASRESYASWAENGSLGQTWLHPDKASVERIPAGVVLFRTHQSFTVPGRVDQTPTSGPVSVSGDGWAGFATDSSVSYGEFCGEDATAYAIDSRGEIRTMTLDGSGTLSPGTYLVKVDPPCTISLDDTGDGDTDPSQPTVVDIDGAPVPDATVLTYDSESGDVRDSYATDSDGALPADVDVSAETVVVKKSGWFDVLTDAPSTITLDKQVLSYPTPVDRDGDIYSTVTVWRRVNPTDHREQVLYTELTDANELSDVNGKAEYEIANDSNSSQQSLGDGFFTVSYPERTVTVDRAGYPSDSNGMEPADATVLGRYQTIQTRRGLSLLERWHPLRTDLPVYPFPTDNGDERFTTLTGNEERLEKTNALLRLGATTALGPLGTVIEGANTLFGDSIRAKLTTTRRVGDYTIGDEVTQQEFKRVTGPADHDSVTQSWSPGPASPLSGVTQAVPLTIDESADRCSVVARASWNQFGGKAIFTTKKTLWPIRTAPGE
ncbi:MAG: twin-arginine translocation signal domain-containing protein [Haloarculaceae archaeon]